jgi:2-methylcitrate dehydratase PrpD
MVAVDWISATIAAAWDGPPEGSEAARKARLLVLDSLGCALAGLRHARPAGLAAALAGAGFSGALRLPGFAQGLAPGAAAAVLAAASCWDEANEGLARAHGRPALPVAPLALVALQQGAPLGTALAAFALGYETGGRAGELWAIRPGMHVDGSWHSLGAAACAARLVGLDAAGVARAVRLAAVQIPFSLYAPIAAGMDGRNLFASHAALLGSLAAAGAAAGMDAPEGGFFEARALALGLEGPGSCAPPGEWLLLDAYLKPFAGVRHAHYAAAAALALRDRLGGREVTAIRLATYAEALRYAGNRAPASAIAAQFSLSWAVAAALRQGGLGPEAYAEAALADAELRRLEAMVELAEDPALSAAAGRRGATLRVTAGGEVLKAAVDGVTGDPDHPMSEAEAVAKFLRFAAPSLGADRARAVSDALLGAPPDVPLPMQVLTQS